MYGYVCTVVCVRLCMHGYVCTVMCVRLCMYGYVCTVMYGYVCMVMYCVAGLTFDSRGEVLSSGHLFLRAVLGVRTKFSKSPDEHCITEATLANTW